MSRVETREAETEHNASLLDDGPHVPAALANAIAYNLRLAQEASFQAFRQRVGNDDLKPGRYTILNILAENPGLTPTDLSRACGRDKSTLTPTLKDLVRRGLVVRRRHETDERSYTVHLTPAGIEQLQRLRNHAFAHDQQLDQIVGADKKVEFMEMLRRITDVLGGR